MEVSKPHPPANQAITANQETNHVAHPHPRGHIARENLLAVKAAGYTDAQVIEIVQHVALNPWTNYFNEVFNTDIDFPVVEVREAA